MGRGRGTAVRQSYKARRPITQEEDVEIARLRSEGRTLRQISVAMGRSIGAVSKHLSPKYAVGSTHNPSRYYTPEEDAQIVRLRDDGVTFKAIGDALNRNLQSVQGRYKKLLEHLGRDMMLEMRSCIICKRDFQSEGIHNRVCGACKNTANWRDGDDTHRLAR